MVLARRCEYRIVTCWLYFTISISLPRLVCSYYGCFSERIENQAILITRSKQRHKPHQIRLSDCRKSRFSDR